jgi:transposase-like protein
MHYLLLTAFIIATHCILSIKTDTATIASYGQICSASPVSNLNVCNNTCSACVASSSYKCTSCNSQFTLSNQICSVDNSIHTYTVNRYLNALNANQMSVDIAKFIFADTKVALNATRTA